MEIVQAPCVHVVVMKAVDVRTDGQTDGRQGFLRVRLDKAEQG